MTQVPFCDRPSSSTVDSPPSNSSAEHRDGIPLRRPGHAREIGAAVAFLASPEASYVTGEILVVDGGMLLMAAVANQLAS